MRIKPAKILVFLVLGIFLTSSPPQAVAARLAESRFEELSDPLAHRLALPLLINDLNGQAAVSTLPSLAEAQEVDAREESRILSRGDWRWHPPGEIQVPILMYHHVGDFDPPFRYAVPLQAFEEQMRSLNAWGYTTISLATMVEALTVGADLPERPIVITFDDGYMNVYEQAFPVMQNYGYQGVAYIIAGQVEIGGFMHADQLKELRAAGWEIGSHTYHHLDLRQAGTNLQVEISEAKNDLETLIDGPVDTFSFPYGLTTPYATRLVEQAGFQSAVGLGGLSRHTLATRLYLSRIEVQGDFALNTFAGLLPWVGPLGSNDPFAGSDQ
jgi:peptidoglycan/xylan/chitin deacetylase (PgdA/CDA1 family)